MAISPTMIMLWQDNAGHPGIEIDQHLLKPKEYHGAFEGLGATVELAGCSSGA